ncbi:hypothetical protein AAHE18_17G218300 [Arachis hypogaea]
MQLIMVPEKHLHLFFKKARAGDNPNAEERLEEFDNVDNALKEFTRLFEENNGNQFEPWERDEKFCKKPLKFYPIDMVLCIQEIYRYVLMEMGYDSPDLPIGMVAQLHLKRCEKALLEFIEKVKSLKEN